MRGLIHRVGGRQAVRGPSRVDVLCSSSWATRVRKLLRDKGLL